MILNIIYDVGQLTNKIYTAIASIKNNTTTISSNVSSISSSLNSITPNVTLIKQSNFGTLYDTSYTINAPGIYELYENIDFNPSSSSQAIIINSSNVVLNLKAFKINNQSSASVDGILVNADLENIYIKNGSIQNFSNRAIVIQSGCKNISLYKMACQNCAIAAVEFLGSNIDPIKLVSVNCCKFSDCSKNSSAAHTFYMYYVNDSEINNCCISENGSVSSILSLLKMEQCLQCKVRNTVINSNAATSTLMACDIITTNYCTFRDLIVSNNQAATVQGFKLSSNSSGNEFFRCNATTNIGTTEVDGFLIGSSCNNNALKDCYAVLNNSAGSDSNTITQGFNSNSNSFNVFYRCMALNNKSPSSTATYGAIGFNIDTCTSCTLSRCKAYDQSSNATAVGIKINAGSSCIIEKCESKNQTVGYRLDPNNNLNHSFLQNISASNSTHYEQFPVGSNQSASDITTLNGNLTNPWTNIAMN